MPQTVEMVLQSAAYYSDGQAYSFVQLPIAASTAAAGVVAEIGEPFVALLIDKDEISLLISSEAWSDFAHRLPGAQLSPIPYRLLTIDMPLESDLVGLIAHISQALAAAQISILPFAAFSRDHIFVAEKDFDQALAVLNTLKSEAMR